MEHGRPSLTAQRVAMRRAAHQLFDRPTVLQDPIALRIIGPECAAEIRSAPQQFDGKLARRLRAFLVARSRCAEDELAGAVQRGVRQYVILGAGLDTFAYRSPYAPPALRVFEVDHPATQAWKRELLDAAKIPVPESVSFVPLDFEREALAEQLRLCGFRTKYPAFFSWLGVTMYLTREAVLTTLKSIAASTPEGSEAVFDFAIDPSSLSTGQQRALRSMSGPSAAAGEPWQSFFDPRSLAAELRSIGFEQAEDIGPEEINARYFKSRTDELQVGSLAHLMKVRR
jgi:methyltransferase (TIGR00027 family)